MKKTKVLFGSLAVISCVFFASCVRDFDPFEYPIEESYMFSYGDDLHNGIRFTINKKHFKTGDKLVVDVAIEGEYMPDYAFAMLDDESIGQSNEFPCSFEKKMEEAGTYKLTIGYAVPNSTSSNVNWPKISSCVTIMVK